MSARSASRATSGTPLSINRKSRPAEIPPGKPLPGCIYTR